MLRAKNVRQRNRVMETRPEVRYPTDEELARAASAVHFEAGKSNDPHVQKAAADPAFWQYSERYALAALMAYLNP